MNESYDFQKTLLGEVPLGFFLEVIFRLFFLFLIIILSIRLIGRRMSSSLNRNDLASMSSIAAAIGVPMQDPSKGLLPALIVALVIVGITKIMNRAVFNSKKFEKRMQGNFDPLVKDGMIDLKKLKINNISKERLFAQLRSENLEHLGPVQRLYMESSGNFTLLRMQPPKPGLSVIPDWDYDFKFSSQRQNGNLVCSNCGWLNEKKRAARCVNCGKHSWSEALMD